MVAFQPEPQPWAFEHQPAGPRLGRWAVATPARRLRAFRTFLSELSAEGGVADLSS